MLSCSYSFQELRSKNNFCPKMYPSKTSVNEKIRSLLFCSFVVKVFFLFLCLLYFIGLATCQLDIVFPNGPFSKITTFSIMINGLQINYLQQQQQQQGYLFFLSRWCSFRCYRSPAVTLPAEFLKIPWFQKAKRNANNNF